MIPQKTLSIPLPRPDSGHLKFVYSELGAPLDPMRARILSYNRVSEQIAELIYRRFWGRLVLRFEAGRVAWVKVEEAVEE